MSFKFKKADLFSRDLLEFPAILELLRPFLSGPVSQRTLDQIVPRAELPAIQHDLELAREAGDYVQQSPRPIWCSLIDPLPILEKLRIAGVTCSSLEILGVVEVAKATCHARHLFVETPCKHLHELACSAPDLRDLVRDLDGKILPDGSIESSASPVLGRIRRSIERTQQELHSALKRRGKWKALFMDRVRPELLSTLNLWKRFPSITNWLSFKTAKKRRFAAFWRNSVRNCGNGGKNC